MPMVSLIVTVKLRLLSFHKTSPVPQYSFQADSSVILALAPVAISYSAFPPTLLGQGTVSAVPVVASLPNVAVPVCLSSCCVPV